MINYKLYKWPKVTFHSANRLNQEFIILRFYYLNSLGPRNVMCRRTMSYLMALFTFRRQAIIQTSGHFLSIKHTGITYPCNLNQYVECLYQECVLVRCRLHGGSHHCYDLSGLRLPTYVKRMRAVASLGACDSYIVYYMCHYMYLLYKLMMYWCQLHPWLHVAIVHLFSRNA